MEEVPAFFGRHSHSPINASAKSYMHTHDAALQTQVHKLLHLTLKIHVTEQLASIRITAIAPARKRYRAEVTKHLCSASQTANI